MTMKVPALRDGNGFLGAEWFGCMNTGRRAKIVKLRGVFLVGWQNDFDTILNTAKGRAQFFVPGKRVLSAHKAKLWKFKNRSGAVAKFHALNQTVLDFNATEADRAKRAAEARRRGDFATAWQLSD